MDVILKRDLLLKELKDSMGSIGDIKLYMLNVGALAVSMSSIDVVLKTNALSCIDRLHCSEMV